MLSAFPLKEGKTAHMLIASRSTFMVAFVPSADRIGHSADTDQRRLSAGHRCLCLPDHRKLRTGPVLWLFLPSSNTEFLIGNGTWPFLTSPAKAMIWLVSIFR